MSIFYRCAILLDWIVLVYCNIQESFWVQFVSENTCWNLVLSQTNLTLVYSSNSKVICTHRNNFDWHDVPLSVCLIFKISLQSCGNLIRGWNVYWEEKKVPKTKGKKSCMLVQCTFASELKPFTEYNVMVELYNGSIVLNETVRTLKPGE